MCVFFHLFFTATLGVHGRCLWRAQTERKNSTRPSAGRRRAETKERSCINVYVYGVLNGKGGYKLKSREGLSTGKIQRRDGE